MICAKITISSSRADKQKTRCSGIYWADWPLSSISAGVLLPRLLNISERLEKDGIPAKETDPTWTINSSVITLSRLFQIVNYGNWLETTASRSESKLRLSRAFWAHRNSSLCSSPTHSI